MSFGRLAAVAAVFVLVLGNIRAEAASATDHAHWCVFDRSADRTIWQQPLDSGNCAAFQVGGAIATVFAPYPEAIQWVMGQDQYGLGNRAADVSCFRNDLTDQVAIRLLQICQCHNTGAQDAIEHNQSEVIAALRQWRGC